MNITSNPSHHKLGMRRGGVVGWIGSCKELWPIRTRIHSVILCHIMLLMILLVASASAQRCDEFDVFEAVKLRTAHVKDEAGPRLYFHQSGTGCPEGKGCQAKAYLVPGDQVLLMEAEGPFVCAVFRGAKRDTAGWLPRAGLIINPPSSVPTREDWLGRWVLADNLILVEPKAGDRLFFKGWAFTPPYSLSDFDLETVPKGSKVVYRLARCAITLHWVDGLIVANNTLGCTGAGNSFSGIYVRRALTTDPEDEPPELRDKR